MVGALTLVYDHHVHLLGERLTEIQHSAHHLIRSTLHVHLDHQHCLEVIVLQGRMGEIDRIANSLLSTKGVQHGKLTVTAAEPHSHSHSE
jgi:CopG family nickel-responsive transcriptional regulator